MSYNSVRNAEIIASFDPRIEDFVRVFNPGSATIILLPGGMGSQLDRSTKKYSADNESRTLDPYNPLWMSLGILFGDAVNLAMDKNGRDTGDRIIVADGPLRFWLQSLTPYDATEKYFRQQGYNYLVFGYDWRRPIDESADYFRRFLAALRKRIKAVHSVELGDRLTLLTHSMGGLVAKLLLNMINDDPEMEADGPMFRQFISVAAPFFGTSTNIRRYYIGQDPLTQLYGRVQTAKIAGSMPGPYILNYLDHGTYDRCGAALGLTQYPMYDSDTMADTDPYDPANRDRFPSWVNAAHIAGAKVNQQDLAKPLSKALRDRVFHIRSGLDKQTPVAHEWKRFEDPDAGDPNEQNPALKFLPIKDVPGDGDGTVPFWSARLPDTADDHIYACFLASDHGELMEHGEVLETIYYIIDHNVITPLTGLPDVIETPPRASKEKLNAVIEGIKSGAIQRDDPTLNDQALWRRIVVELNP